ncbi:hypothetical protein AgCh_021696 [Apium graveolens]
MRFREVGFEGDQVRGVNSKAFVENFERMKGTELAWGGAMEVIFTNVFVAGTNRSGIIANVTDESMKYSNEVRENMGNDSEINGLLVLDCKRRRTEGLKGPTDEEMLDSQIGTQQNQKNLIGAGYEGMVVVEPQGRSGGLAFFWRDRDQANLLSLSQHHIDVEVSVDGLGDWRITGVYGELKRSSRRKTWDLLRNLSRDSNLPWCTIGDMNNVTSQQDKRGGEIYPTWLIDGFNKALTDAGLRDMELTGHRFTWERGRGKPEWTEVRLDRAMVTQDWMDLFPMANLYNLEGSNSDHSPIFLVPKKREESAGVSMFRFENAWLLEPMCQQLVSAYWKEDGEIDIQSKVKACSEVLVVWGKEITGNFGKVIKECKRQLKKLRNKDDDQPIQEFLEVKKKLHLTLDQREIFWRQRSKQLWLKSGDKNSRYFHAAATTRKKNNQITKLQDLEGTWKEWDNGLENLIINYYRELFSGSQSHWEEVVKNVPTSITQDQNDSLLMTVTDEEVKAALFSMHPDKAPGPDGMTPAFYHRHWQIVGRDIVNLVRRFFEDGQMPQGLNDINVVLIPKKKYPMNIGDLRPISLCNVLVKVITKVMANRLKVKYQVTHGRRMLGYVEPGRGIRQGDPLSPYLFILCAEGFSATIKKFDSNKWLTGVKICKQAPTINHMLFADDSYVYCKANKEEADKVRELLGSFERATGQQVNYGKSSIFFSSNVVSSDKMELCGQLQMQEANERSTYLGLPTMLGRNKSALMGYLKERIDSRIRSWEEGFISRSGKEVLIKNVAQALPSYAMSVFLLPQGITNDMERMLARYWWRSKPKQDTGINWMSWSRLSKHKSAGGMGFRDFYDFNLSMLAKQGWRFLTKPDSLVNDPYVSSESPSFEHNKVTSLMKTYSRQWDTEIIADLFNERDQRCIFNTKINSRVTEDQIYWKEEDSGDYSVRSAYRLLQAQKARWTVDDNGSLWRKIWQVKAPPKVLNLIWRALSYCLPTMVMLAQKYVPVLKVCPVCNVEEKTIIHALVTCPFANQCWQRVIPDVQQEFGRGFEGWLEKVMNSINKDRRVVVVTVCWAIWKARNEKHWNKKQVSLNDLLAPAKIYLNQWQESQGRTTEVLIQLGNPGDGANSWVAPQMVTIKVNVDAAIFKDPSAFGVGLIARDSRGELMYACSTYYKDDVSPELAEVLAIKEALSWIMEQAWEEFQLESDCLVAVQAIRSNVTMSSPFGVVVEECRSLIRNSNKVNLSFVRRSANMAAHFLAKESCSYPDRVISRSDVPIDLHNVLMHDLA